MTPAYVVQITTPKNYVLNGLWFGPKKPKRALIIFIHGLTSSTFSMLNVVSALADTETAVLTFNNRGHDIVSKLYAADKKRKRILAGAAHERFTDCVDDIQGAINFARKSDARNIYLAGHSTGCQKSVYWASKKGKGVQGIILLAPVSDYASALERYGAAKLSRVANYARNLVRRGKPHEPIPHSIWPEELDDAQRFLSLYTPDSAEEIFTYAQAKKRPATLQKVRIPALVLWAENDEFSDRPAEQAAVWFEKQLRNKHEVLVIPKVGHSFKGGEKAVAKAVRAFMKET